MNWLNVFQTAATRLRRGDTQVVQTGIHSTALPPSLTTGFSRLDAIIGLKGLPQGHLTELMGVNTDGLVCIAAKIAAKFQQKQRPVRLIDAAGIFPLTRLPHCGLMAPELFYHRPQDVPDLLQQLEAATQQPGLAVIGLGLTSQTLTADPRKLKALLRRIRGLIHGSQTAFLFVTRAVRDDPFSLENYPPGFPLADLATVRLWVYHQRWQASQRGMGGYHGTVAAVKTPFTPSGASTNVRIKFTDPTMAQLRDDFGF